MKALLRCGAVIWFGVLMLALVPGLASATRVADGTKPERLSAADRQKIQRVITLQIRAFERNDETVAFSYSTPEIRKYFGSSRTFMEMVRDGYSVLYMHASHEFLEAAVVDGRSFSRCASSPAMAKCWSRFTPLSGNPTRSGASAVANSRRRRCNRPDRSRFGNGRTPSSLTGALLRAFMLGEAHQCLTLLADIPRQVAPGCGACRRKSHPRR